MCVYVCVCNSVICIVPFCRGQCRSKHVLFSDEFYFENNLRSISMTSQKCFVHISAIFYQCITRNGEILDLWSNIKCKINFLHSLDGLYFNFVALVPNHIGAELGKLLVQQFRLNTHVVHCKCPISSNWIRIAYRLRYDCVSLWRGLLGVMYVIHLRNRTLRLTSIQSWKTHYKFINLCGRADREILLFDFVYYTLHRFPLTRKKMNSSFLDGNNLVRVELRAYLRREHTLIFFFNVL